MVTTPAPEDDVEKLLTGIMSKQSPTMKLARTQGLQSAQTMGLGQSTKGIQAAQAAAYQAALPIASQQSQQAHQKGMQGAQFGHETTQQRELFGHQTGMQGAQFGHETGMQTRGFQHAAGQSELDRALQKWQTETQAWQQGAERAQQSWLQQQELASRERISSMEISAADKERALSAMAQFNNSYSAAYGAISQNPDLPAEARNQMLAHLDNVRTHNQNLTTSLYRYAVPW